MYIWSHQVIHFSKISLLCRLFTVHTVVVILNLNELMAPVCLSFIFISGLLLSVSPEWLFDRSVPANGSHHVLQTNLEQLHGARLPVSLYETF